MKQLPKLSLSNVDIKKSFTDFRTKSPEERKKVYVYAGTLILFSAAAVYSFTNFIKINKISAASMEVPSVQIPVDTGIKEAAKKMNDQYSAYIKLREETPELVALSEAVGRSPVSAVVPPPAQAPDTKVPDFVPTLKIRALVVLGGTSICTLDIDDEEPGKIFKPGAIFGKGKGRILSIDSEGVSWQWANKKHRTKL